MDTTQNLQETPEWLAGKAAFLNGYSDSVCPYPIRSGDPRTRWMTGYYDSHVDDFLFQMDKKYSSVL